MKNFLLIMVALLFISGAAFSQNINGRFSSSVYAFERFDTVQSSQNHLRAYEMLNLNINQDKFSIKTYMNLESDLSQKMESDPRLRFYNLYLEGRNLFDFFTFKLGRQPIFNSIGGGLMDGINADFKYNDFKLNAFYGSNVPAYQKLKVNDDWENDYLWGAKLSTNYFDNLQVDVSYIKKNYKAQEFNAVRLDEELNPIQTLIRNKSNTYEFVSGEISYDMKKIFSVNTRYDYDLNFEKTSKVEFNGRYEQIDNLGINFYYNYREPRINYNSIFSVFDFGSNREYELGADYAINKVFTVIGKFGLVNYGGDNSQRLTVGANTNLGSLTYRKNFGYAGELDAVSLYTAHTFLEGLLTPSLGLSYTKYKLSKYDEESNDLVSALLGLNYRPIRSLSFDLQGQYLNNKIYKDDYRVFLKLNYWFNTNLNLL
ncbi:MAG TPA: hypothetical protein VFF33_12960 [Ignavibacteriaceae bacterium]|nr:hypothetical protein [Ignavibacteriaceae bacterium]